MECIPVAGLQEIKTNTHPHVIKISKKRKAQTNNLKKKRFLVKNHYVKIERFSLFFLRLCMLNIYYPSGKRKGKEEKQVKIFLKIYYAKFRTDA